MSTQFQRALPFFSARENARIASKLSIPLAYLADRWFIRSNVKEQTLDKKYEYISYCGKYYCASCDYQKGTIAKAAKNLLAFAERMGH